jgi:hypothetical protein
MPFLYIDKMQNEEYVKKTDASPALEGILDEKVKPSLAESMPARVFVLEQDGVFFLRISLGSIDEK